MIALVVVCHSRALAHAARDLALEMAPADHRPVVEVAAGLDDGRTGTDASAIQQAVVRADDANGGDGVLVLLDLGSAVLSAEMAVEMLEPGLAARVGLTPAPLIGLS